MWGYTNERYASYTYSRRMNNAVFKNKNKSPHYNCLMHRILDNSHFIPLDIFIRTFYTWHASKYYTLRTDCNMHFLRTIFFFFYENTSWEQNYTYNSKYLYINQLKSNTTYNSKS